MAKICDFGIRFLDDKLLGFFERDLVVIGASSGIGKSSLSILLARNALRQGVQTCLMSLENGVGAVKQKLTFIEYAKGQERFIKEREFVDEYDKDPDKFSQYTTLWDELNSKVLGGDIPLFDLVEDYKEVDTVEKLIDKIKVRIGLGYKIFIIDHIDCLPIKYAQRNDFISQVMQALYELAYNNNVCIITFSQVSKSINPNIRIPGKNDLVGGADKINKATLVITMARDKYYDDDIYKRFATLVAIRKDRYGQFYMGRLYFKNGDYDDYYQEVTDFDERGFIVDGMNIDKLIKSFSK